MRSTSALRIAWSDSGSAHAYGGGRCGNGGCRARGRWWRGSRRSGRRKEGDAMADLPIPYGPKALSVRQPWAHAIIFLGKDIENRSHASIRHMDFRGVDRIAIHAAKGMTRDEYEDAADFMASIGVECPKPSDLQRGGIIGSVAVSGLVSASSSKWFMGPNGIVLADPQPCEFIPAVGALGLFEWEPAPPSILPAPARWMLAGRETKDEWRSLL
jgi:hypothetical protein